jgi:hypothetical protein
MLRLKIAVVVFAASVFVAPLQSQETPKKNPIPKPAPGPSEALLSNWNEIGRKLIAMAEDFPEDKYDFKAAPSAGTFAQRLIHAAAANYFFTSVALGQKPPAEEDPKRDQFKNKAEVVAYVKKSFADGAAAIKAKGTKDCPPRCSIPSLRTIPIRPENPRYGSLIWPMAWPSTPERSTANSLFTTASRA